MSSLVTSVLVVPLLTALVGLAAWRAPRAQAPIAVVGALAHLSCTVALLAAVLEHGVLVAPMGGWPAPFGISLVADPLSALLLAVTGLLGVVGTISAASDLDRARVESGAFPLMHVLLAGVSGSFVTGDLFNLYVSFEIMLIASFVLLAVGGGREALEGATKYVALNLVGSALFLMGAGTIYGLARTLNMADLHGRLQSIAQEDPTAVMVAGTFLLVAFALKAGAFPLGSWLPASYHTPPTSISALFAGLLTKVGIYALLRASTVVLPVPTQVFELMLWVAGLTMVMGVLGAVAQFDVRRILGFHVLSQIGYMLMGLGLLAAPDPGLRVVALAATVFYVTHHILVKTNLYLIGGLVERLGGGSDLAHTGGLAARAPWLAALFLVPALSLAGLPPLSGFWAKLAVLRAGLHAEQYVVVAAAAVAGLLTLVSMLKIWNEGFWKPHPRPERLAVALPRAELWSRVVPIVVLAVATLTLGVAPAPLLDLADRAAEILLDPAPYVEAVSVTRVEEWLGVSQEVGTP